MDEDKFVEKLKEALTYGGSDRPALVARIPVICNDIRWIKMAIMGLYGLIGIGIGAQWLASLGVKITF